MHKLSIVIVNYNVKHFLEQVLVSVEKAICNVDAEVWVVDNNSVDGSMEMVVDKFPWVKTICNKVNVGFSKANNQAIRESKSEYVLLLNPDTVLQDDSLVKCLDYLDNHQDVGGLGVRMIDGKGNFLPESKRGLPTPKVAFFKMTGLATLFPKSRYFGKYHMKYLPENETHEVDVLSGAFMMMRCSVLEKVGLLDEDFFMYGEDIDLSYRITLGGYKNVYFSDTTIIHYKGESTKKKSANYVKVFYNAMVLFAQKHYSQRMAGWFAFWIKIAIYLRASLAVLFRGIQSVFLPALDFIGIYLGYLGIAKYWELYHKFVRGFYPEIYYAVHIPIYVLAVLLAIFISGGYDKPFQGKRLLRGAVIGAIALFVVYGFMPKNLQFSRAILALGSAWALGILFFIRLVAQFFKLGEINLTSNSEKRIILVGSKEEATRIQQLLNRSQVNHQMLGWVLPTSDRTEGFLGGIHQLSEIIEIYKSNLVIFSGKDVAASEIMKTMSLFAKSGIQLKIAPDKGESIIGSSSKNDPGELFTIEVKYELAEMHQQRRKRIFDVLFSCLILATLPLFLIFAMFNKSIKMILKNVFGVLFGYKTWVSYSNSKTSEFLPKLKTGVFSISGNWKNTIYEGDVNLLYAKEYHVSKDLNRLMHSIFNKPL
jgi:O-antigen biosynthesis protein